ncbi:MAG: DUF1295 domain-containing protein [Candidatus Dadabacteria bacterium]|nr:DUF1295 domain-containing protein [Candidatus Dadabacteria bacterium]NIQ15257.1 DUF1295 domain-containing protein [Candidatus Dadabacteria bacterium]
MIFVSYLFPIKYIFNESFNLFGILIVLLGISIILITARLFKRFNTPIKPFKQSTYLITTGLYKYTRNPIYLGMVIILIGLAIYLGSVSSFFVIPIFIWLIQTNFIEIEEEGLLNTFGRDYVSYKKKVRRWI